MNRVRVGVSLAGLFGLAVAFQNCGPKGFGTAANQDLTSSAQTGNAVPAPISTPTPEPTPTTLSSYFVSATGSDSNDGKSSITAWKTIAKVNATNFAGGDGIYFRSGDTFYGQVNINTPSVTVSAYGPGAKPVITGAVPLTGWTVYSGSVYVTTAPGLVKNLFSGGTQMTVARYPNSGFIAVTSAEGATTVTSAGLSQGAGTWTGASFHLRSEDWVFESRQITSSTGNSVTLVSKPDYGPHTGWGFYIDNSLAALDAPGEWYCDPGTNKVYFYAPGGVDPNTLSIVGAVQSYGLNSSQSSTIVRGLSFQYQTLAGVHIGGSAASVQVLSNDILGSWMNGVEFVGTHNTSTIDGNTIVGSNGQGIATGGGQGIVISNNTVTNTGLVSGYGLSGNYGMIAIAMTSGTQCTISGNVIDGTGYAGILPCNSSGIIEKNIIKNTMKNLNDGGAIYMYQQSGHILRNNIITNVTSNLSGTVGKTIFGIGIYWDLNSHDMQAYNNTVINVATNGLFSQYQNFNNLAQNNIFYGSGRESVMMYVSSELPAQHGGNTLTGNIFRKYGSNYSAVYVVNTTSGFPSFGLMDGNYYIDSLGQASGMLAEIGISKYSTYSLAQWRSVSGQEAHGMTVSPAPVSDNLLVNDTPVAKTFTLTPITYRGVDGASVSGSITLQPYTSKLLFQ